MTTFRVRGEMFTASPPRAQVVRRHTRRLRQDADPDQFADWLADLIALYLQGPARERWRAVVAQGVTVGELNRLRRALANL